MPAHHILLVEDSDDDALLLTWLFEKKLPDCTITRVDTLDAVLQELNRHIYDAVVSDYVLVGFTGLDVLNRIRSYEFDLPFILISGTVGEDTAVEAVRAGAADYVMKDNLTRLPTSLMREIRAHEMRRQKRASEKHLLQQQADMAALLENTEDCIWSIDRNLRISILNPAAKSCFRTTFGADLEPGRYFPDPLPAAVVPVWDALIRHAFTGKKSLQEIRFGNDESSTMMEVSVNPIRNANTGIVGVSFFAKDITQRKSIERKLTASLREKEILLAEVHHRVKNNLAIITGILALQQDRFDDARYLDLYSEAITKIKSIALIHELLYQTDSFESIDFRTYLTSLTRFIQSSVDIGSRIRIQVDADESRMGLNMAVPCGLIVSELVTNAFKHAFHGAEGGAVDVEFRVNGDRFTLRVRDSGTSVRSADQLSRDGGLGMALVSGLTEQLGGSLSYDFTNGTTIIMESWLTPSS